MDRNWAILQLSKYIELSRASGDRDEAVGQKAVVLKILQQIPEARNTTNLRHACLIARKLLERGDEIKQRLGETGPHLAADSLHPDVWDAAKSLWRNGHFTEAVVAAAVSVNAQAQARTERRDAGESKLIGDSFSTKPPEIGRPRLRLCPDDGSDTFTSVHEGAAAFGRGCYMAIRNVLTHENGALAELDEQQALERLAAFSILARWIAEATVERAD